MFKMQSKRESGSWTTIKTDDDFDAIYDWFTYSTNNPAPSAIAYRMTEDDDVVTEWTR